MKNSNKQRKTRHNRIRLKVHGTPLAPRLSVFRSNKHIYVQVIDDQKSQTIVAASDLHLKVAKDKLGKIEKATLIGEAIAEKAKAKKITKVIFDRGGFKFHGRIKALAEGARKGGLKF